VKNNWDSKNIVFGMAGIGHDRFIYDDTVFLLAIVLVDGALFGFESLDDLQRQQIPPGEDELILRFKESALNLRKLSQN
jgi:hypothetical protein